MPALRRWIKSAVDWWHVTDLVPYRAPSVQGCCPREWGNASQPTTTHVLLGKASGDVIILVLLPLLDLFAEPETAGVNAACDWAEVSSFIKAADQRLAVNAALSDRYLRYLQLSPLMIIHKMKVVHQMCSYEPERAAPSITELRRPPQGKDASHLIDSGQTHSPPPGLHSGDQRRSEAVRVEAGPEPSAPQSYMSGDSIKGFHLYAWIIFFSPCSVSKEQSRVGVVGASDTSGARGAFLFCSVCKYHLPKYLSCRRNPIRPAIRNDLSVFGLKEAPAFKKCMIAFRIFAILGCFGAFKHTFLSYFFSVLMMSAILLFINSALITS